MNDKITLKRLAELSAETAGCDAARMQDFIKQLFGNVADQLTQGNEVEMRGLGKFAATDDPQHPLVFTPAPELADTLNAPFAMFSAVEVSDNLSQQELDAVEEVVTVPEPEPELEPKAEPEPEPEPVTAPEPIVEPEPVEMRALPEPETVEAVQEAQEDEDAEETAEAVITDATDDIAPLPEPESVLEPEPVAEECQAAAVDNQAADEPAETVTEEEDTPQITTIPEDEEEYVEYDEEQPRKTRFWLGFFIGLISGLVIGVIMWAIYVIYYLKGGAPLF